MSIKTVPLGAKYGVLFYASTDRRKQKVLINIQNLKTEIMINNLQQRKIRIVWPHLINGSSNARPPYLCKCLVNNEYVQHQPRACLCVYMVQDDTSELMKTRDHQDSIDRKLKLEEQGFTLSITRLKVPNKIKSLVVSMSCLLVVSVHIFKCTLSIKRGKKSSFEKMSCMSNR